MYQDITSSKINKKERVKQIRKLDFVICMLVIVFSTNYRCFIKREFLFSVRTKNIISIDPEVGTEAESEIVPT